MKQNRNATLILGTAVALVFVLLFSAQDHFSLVFARPSYTSSNTTTPSRNTCTSCHNGSAAAGGSAVVNFPSGLTYTPGVTQHLSVTITDPTHTRGGYQLTARLASSLSAQAGSFKATDTNSSVVTNGSIQDMDATNFATLTWNFDWTPPVTASGNVNFYVTGLATGSPGGSTSGNGIYQSVSTLTPAAPPPDFTLSASPTSVSINQGSKGSSIISVTPQNGFTGSVSLAASGLPSGVTASFSPSSATSTSTLTLTASAGAALGTSTVTITGSSGSLVHTTTVVLTVGAPADFSLSASPTNVSINQGSNGSSIIAVTPQNGFTGSVSLAASGLPSGVTASFSPSSTSSSSTLTLTASAGAATGTTTVTITGTSGSLVHTAAVSLTINAGPDFSLSVSPASVTLAQGANGSSTVSVLPQNGFTGSVSLAASGLPSGVTASFGPNATTSTSTLTLTASAGAATGTATVTITGTSGSLSHTATVALTVTPPPDFSLSASPTSVTVAQGFSGSSTITVAPQNGFVGSVSLAASGLPSGVTASFSPNSATRSTLTLAASAGAATGTYTVTITGTSGSLSHTTTLALTVSATATPDFGLSVSPVSLSAAQGASGSSTVTISPQNGFTGSVGLVASGLPSGVTASFSPSFTTSSSALTLSASGAAAIGTATITITGTSGSLNHTTTVSLTVTAPADFSLSAAPASLSISQGSSGSSVVTITAQNGFSSSVNLAASGLPSGVTASFNPASTTNSSTLTLTAAATAVTGPATVTVTGTSGTLVHSTTVSLTVDAGPDFILSASPSALTVTQGSNGSSTIGIAAQNGFTGNIGLTASGLPSGVTASFNPSSTTNSSTLTLSASTSAATGTSTVTITGTSGSLNHTTTLALTVAAAAPTLSATPTTISFSYQIGSPVPGPQAVSVTASPGSASFTTASQGSTWLSVTPASGSTPSVVSVAVDPANLAAGTYNDMVTISASGTTGSPQSVAITLAVSNATSTRKVSTTPASSYPNLVIDGQGNYNLAWTDSTAGVFFARSLDQGSTFPSSVVVQGSSGAVFQPQFVVDGTGQYIDIVWAQSTSTPGSYNVLFSRSTDGGQHFASAPTPLTRVPLPLASAPRIALEPGGGVDVVWGRNEAWAIHSPDGAMFPLSAVQISAVAQDSGGPRIAIDSTGKVYIAWTDETNKLAAGSYCMLTNTSASSFSNTVGGNFYFNVTGSGAAFAASNTRNLSKTDWAGVSTRWAPGFFGCSYDNLSLLVDSQDNLHMVWSTDSPDQSVLASAYPILDSSGKSRVSFPAILSTASAASPHAVLANNGSGTQGLYVVWSDGPSDLNAQVAPGIFYTHSNDTTAPFGRTFAAPATRVTASPAEFPEIGVDGGGNVNVAWQQNSTSSSNAFDVFLSSSFDGGNSFASPALVSEHFSDECLGTNRTHTEQVPPPPTNTCGSVQLKVDSGNDSSLVWVDRGAGKSDILFARQINTPPPGDFSLSLASSSQTLTNGTATYTLSLIAANGFNQLVTVLCPDGLPAGVACSPVRVTPTASGTAAILNVVKVGSAPGGTYPFTIRADAGLVSHSVQATLVISNTTAPDFSITLNPAFLAALPGQSASFTADIASIAGFSGTVALSCAGLPGGATCSVSPVSVGTPGSATVTVAFPANLAGGTHAFTLMGSGSGINHSQVVTMAVGAITTAISPGPAATIAVGNSANFMVTLSSTSSTTGVVQLGCGGLPAGISCTFSPAQLSVPALGTASSTLTIKVSAKPALAPLDIPARIPPNGLTGGLLLSMLLMIFMVWAAHRRGAGLHAAFARGLATWLLVVILGVGMSACAGVVGGSGSNNGTSGTSSPTSSAPAAQITLQAQSGNATLNLGEISVTVP